MDKLYLHAVIVKKPNPLALARLKAQRFIRNKRKTFYDESEEAFRFRCLPGTYFKDFESRKIDDEITLVMGHLKDKHIEGKKNIESE